MADLRDSEGNDLEYALHEGLHWQAGQSVEQCPGITCTYRNVASNLASTVRPIIRGERDAAVKEALEQARARVLALIIPNWCQGRRSDGSCLDLEDLHARAADAVLQVEESSRG